MEKFVDQLAKSDLRFDEYVFITSSPLTNDAKTTLQDIALRRAVQNIVILGQDDVLNLLVEHGDIARQYFTSVQRIRLLRHVASGVSAAAALLALGQLVTAVDTHPKTDARGSLERQIETVEIQLNSLKDLVRGLTALKKDLQTTSEESARIKREYEEALKLKAVTSEQLEQIKRAVNSSSTSDTLLNYLFGFILGVASSVLATIITDRWTARRALRGP